MIIAKVLFNINEYHSKYTKWCLTKEPTTEIGEIALSLGEFLAKECEGKCIECNWQSYVPAIFYAIFEFENMDDLTIFKLKNNFSKIDIL